MRSIIYWAISSSVAVLSMRALAQTQPDDVSMTLSAVGNHSAAIPENVRAIVLGAGIMALAYTYRRTWLNFRMTGKA